MLVRTTKNASLCKRSLSVSSKVRTTLGTKHLVTEGVQNVEGIHQDLNYQEVEFEINLVVIKTAKYGKMVWVET